MMDISERINKHEQKKKPDASPSVSSASTPPQVVQPSSALQEIRQATAQSGAMENIEADKVNLRPQEELMKQGADWRSLDYDAAIKYNPQLSRSQYISGASQYRRENNMPGFSNEEIFNLLGGKDPFASAEQEKKDEKRMKAAGYIDSIGNVLAHLVNYVRTKNGNPAMNLSSLKENRARLDKLKAYHDALGRSNYAAYMNMLEKERAREAAQTAAEQKFMQEIALQNLKENSPLNKSRLLTEEAKRQGIITDNEYKQLKKEEQEMKNRFLPKSQAAKLAYTNARAAAAGRSNRGSSSGSSSDKSKKEPYKVILKIGNSYSREYDLNNDDDVLDMYWNGVKWELPEYLDQDKYNLYGKSQEAILDLKDIDKIRNVLKYNHQYYITPEDKDYYKYVEINDYPEFFGSKTSADGKNKNNNDLDWQIYE